MALLKCKECYAQVSSDAPACPHCGVRSFKPSKLPLLLCALVGLVIAASFINPNKDSASGLGSSISPQVSLPLKREEIKDSCEKFSGMFGYHSKLTDVQKEQLWESKYKNRSIKWKLQLVSAEKMFDENFEVVFVCLYPSQQSSLVKLIYSKELKNKVLSFKKTTPYLITAALKAYEAPPTELSEQIAIRIDAEPFDLDAKN